MVKVSHLPIDHENVLLEILLDTFLKERKFAEVLNFPRFQDRVPRQKKERRKLTNRRQYLLSSPQGFQAAVDAYHRRQSYENIPCDNKATFIEERVPLSHIQPIQLNFDAIDTTMSHLEQHDECDMEIPINWNPRYNVGAIQLFQGETVTKHHEVRKQIRFCIQVANAKDQDLYSARLSHNRDGIILTEPIVPRHLRDANKLAHWDKISSAVKFEAKNENLSRDISVKVQEINSLVSPVKRTLFRFPDGMTCNNKAFNDNDNGNPPSDGWTLIKWPFMLPDGSLDLPGLPRKLVVDEMGQKERVPYDNLVPGFFWDMALDVEKIERTAQETIMDPTALADRLQNALDLDG